MRSQLIGCIGVNIVAALLSIAVLSLLPGEERLYLHFRDDNTFCPRWSFHCRPFDYLRQYGDRRLSGVSDLRSVVSAQ